MTTPGVVHSLSSAAVAKYDADCKSFDESGNLVKENMYELMKLRFYEELSKSCGFALPDEITNAIEHKVHNGTATLALAVEKHLKIVASFSKPNQSQTVMTAADEFLNHLSSNDGFSEGWEFRCYSMRVTSFTDLAAAFTIINEALEIRDLEAFVKCTTNTFSSITVTGKVGG